MKKILLIISALTLVFSLHAQNRDQVIKTLDKAKAVTQHEKKGTNPNSWIKLAEAYKNAYKFPQTGIWIGSSLTEAKLLLKDQKVLSSEVKSINGVDFTVDTYEDKTLYYNPQGILEVVKVTKPVVNEDMLNLAYESLMKAYQLDTKQSKKKDIAEALNSLKGEYINEAMGAYTLGDIKTANTYFESSLKVTDNPVVEKVDSMITYYTAVTFNMLGEKANAAKYFEKCKDMGYDQNGDVYSALAEIYKSEGNTDKAKEYLNLGFAKYPTSQGILVSLINIYLETNDDPNKVLSLIRTAQSNEPTNASLYYAEGNVYKKLGDMENAIKCYEKSYEIDNNYVFGIYSIGSSYFDQAIEIQKEMDEIDINDYKAMEKLEEEFNQSLLNAIPSFEKAFNSSDDVQLKVAIADGLKQIYFRFREKDESFMKNYEKYNTYYQENQTPAAQ